MFNGFARGYNISMFFIILNLISDGIAYPAPGHYILLHSDAIYHQSHVVSVLGGSSWRPRYIQDNDRKEATLPFVP